MGQETIKSVFFLTNAAVAHYVKLHVIMTDHKSLLNSQGQNGLQ